MKAYAKINPAKGFARVMNTAAKMERTGQAKYDRESATWALLTDDAVAAFRRAGATITPAE